MKYFDDMTNKYGFGDGGAIPPDAWACRAVYLAVLNALAAHIGSAVRAIPFNRPGMHNGCMMLFVSVEDAARTAQGGSEFTEVVPDRGMASAIDQANTLDLDDFVEVTARVTPGAAELVAGLGGAGVRTTDAAAALDSALRRLPWLFAGARRGSAGRVPPLRRRDGRDRTCCPATPSFPISRLTAESSMPGTPTSIGTASDPGTTQPASSAWPAAGCSSSAPLHLNSWR